MGFNQTIHDLKESFTKFSRASFGCMNTSLLIGARLVYIRTARINASAYYPSFHQNGQKAGSADYLRRVMRLHQIRA